MLEALRDDVQRLLPRRESAQSPFSQARAEKPANAPVAGPQLASAATDPAPASHFAPPIGSFAEAVTPAPAEIPGGPASSAFVEPSPLSEAAPAAAGPKRSLENRIGAQLFNRIGIVAILIAVAVFLKLAVDNRWIVPTPTGRVIAGLVVGAGVVLWSERFRRKGYPAFSYSLKAVGTGVLYLALWASFHMYHLLPAWAALLLMIAVTVWNATMAWLQDAELLAVYALVGGFATPSLLGSGGGHFAFLFTYLFAMDLAVLFLVSKKPWQRLILGSFPATVLYFVLWYANYWTPQPANLVAFFVLLLSAPMMAVALLGKQREGVLEGLLTPVASAAFLSLGLYSVLQDSQRHSWLPWVAVALGALYLLLMRLRRNGVAEAVHLALGITFLTVAIPLKAEGRWITIGWLAEGLALMYVAARVFGPEVQARVRSVMRWMACAALALGVGESLLFWAGEDAYSAFWNGRFATEMAAVAAVAVTAWLARGAANALTAAAPTVLSEPEAQGSSASNPAPAVHSLATTAGDTASAPSWVSIALTTILLTHLLAPLAIAREFVAYWHVGPDATALLRDQLSELNVGALLLVYGAVLLFYTLTRVPAETTRRKLLRTVALVGQGLGFFLMLFTPVASNAMSGTVIWNRTVFFELIGLAALAWTTAMAWGQSRTSAAPPPKQWQIIAGSGFVAFNLLALFAGVHEILTFFDLHASTNSGLAEAVSISAWLMVFAAALLTLGFVRRMAFIRWQGLGLLVFTIGKVFLYDLRNLTSIYRVLSFLCLGILLMAVSFAYQKDWLHLRDPEPETPPVSPPPPTPSVPTTIPPVAPKP